MIDIHTHILPGLDDGAQNKSESLEIINELYRQGVDKIIFTPHFYSDNERIDAFVLRRKSAYEFIKSDLPSQIEYSLGAEVYLTKFLFTPSNIEIMQKLCLGSSNRMLIELPYGDIDSDEISEQIQKIKSMGFLTILAHPERYLHEPGINRLYKDLCAQGCEIQLNAASIQERELAKYIKTLLKFDWQKVFLGSDSHNMRRRCPKIKNALEQVGVEYTADMVKMLSKSDL